MRIAVVGAGNVGGTLGRRWAELGHQVTFGVRDPSRGASAVKGGGELPGNARLSAPADAARDADVIVLATPWAAAISALTSLGDIGNKVVIDTTNPLAGGLKLDIGPQGESGAERIQAAVPGARVVKAFNTTGFDNMRDPVYGGAPTVMFYAGDDADAKTAAHELVSVLGFEAVDAGPLARARELEHWALLWISLAFGAGAPSLGRSFAFRLVRR